MSFNYITNIVNRITLIGNEVKKCCRWVVERTFSCLNGYRRLAKDFEYSISSSFKLHSAHIISLKLLFYALRIIQIYD